MITIDGSAGEGGGQVLRNSVALSLVTGQPCQIANIRAGREKPGMMRQHVTVVEAACCIGGAECEGLAIGATDIVFRPGTIVPGDYHFAVGTAGSVGLVLQTMLMPLLFADAPSRLVLEGGTHNMMAPPFDFINRCFLPIINRVGPSVEARLIRHGFYPRGGGRIEVDITPAPLLAIECMDRGVQLKLCAEARFAALPFDIAERELKVAQKQLGWGDECFSVRELPGDQGPGNILLLEAAFENVTEIVSGFGKLGVSAESLAKTAAQRMTGFLKSEAFAGPYLADQLLLPFALAGRGRFTTVKPSLHSRTAADVIEQFTGRRTSFVEQQNGAWIVSVD
jgi:RNA 3'-terminal phosphate cyclase (ATP)